MDNSIQAKTKSPLFWVGMVMVCITAFTSYAASIQVELPWWVGGLGVVASAILAFCNANNPNLKIETK